MKQRLGFVILVLLVLAGTLWWRVDTARRTPFATDPVDGTQTALAPTVRAAEAAAAHAPVVSTDAGVPEPTLEPLDCSAPQGDVVTIDAEGISAAAFCAAWLSLSGPPNRGDPAVMDRQGKALLAQMIDAHLVQRALAAANQAVTDRELSAALDELIAKRSQSPTRSSSEPKSGSRDPRKAFEEAWKAQGGELAQLRADLRQRVGLRKLLELRGDPAPTDDDIEAAYALNPTRWGTPRTATVDGYLARAAPSAPAHMRAQALAAAQSFAAAVPGGNPEQLSRGHGMTRIPTFDVNAHSVEPQLATAAFGLRPRQWSQPLQTNAGWAVLRLIEIKPGQARPLREVRDQVEQALLNQRRLTQQQEILVELRARAKIGRLKW